MAGDQVPVEHRMAELAKTSPNFHFLAGEDLLLASLGASAERHLFTEPSLALVRVRQFVEALVKWSCVRASLPFHQRAKLAHRINALADAGAVDRTVCQVMHDLREVGNKAVHEYYAERRQALDAVRKCFVLASWRLRIETGDRTVRSFTPPPRPADEPEPVSVAERAELAKLNEEVAEYRRRLVELHQELGDVRSSLDSAEAARHRVELDLERVRAEQEHWRAVAGQLSDDLERLLVEREQSKPEKVSARAREDFLRRARRACEPPLTEAQVRERLDALLREAGWAVQEVASKNLFATSGVAVKEVYTDGGYADYLLYVNRTLVGVIEAKREGEDLTKAQAQASRYATSLTKEQRMAARREALPFQYVTDGNETRFRNELDPKPRSRRVFAVHQPETIAAWMREASDDEQSPTLRSRLELLPEVPLDESRLRPAQFDAINGLERSWARNDPRALIQMATGAGKTYAAAGFGYRFLKHAKGKRILFLVDRNNLGDQALAEFDNFTTPDTGRKFGELYGVGRMSGSTVLDSSSVVISTIQRLWLALTGREVPDAEDDRDEEELEGLPEGPAEVGYNPKIPPETFDLIVIDECHRSIYGKWRAVLEYFDAFLVGLTATPVPETYGFFEGNEVSRYSYEESVIDNVNVPFEVYRIGTKIGEQGSTISAGTVVQVRDTKTRRERLEDLEDDYIYSANQEGRQVISKDRQRTVIQEFRDKLFTDIFPPSVSGKGRKYVPKTLIFARTDEHAEEVVAEVRKAFGEGDAFCQKITSKVAKAKDRLQEFRNSRELRIAVTVDMIATGTDVRPLECVFFLREPKTWSLFEQMKGRGARTIDPADMRHVTPDVTAKTHFVIVDAVGVTDTPRPETRPLEKFTERQISLEKLLRKAGSLTLNTDEVQTLASRLTALNNQIEDDEKQELAELAGQPLQEISRGLFQAANPEHREEVREQAVKAADGDEAAGERAVRQLVEDAVRPLAENPELRERILQVRRAHDMVIDEVSKDEITISRGLTEEERARQVVDSFRDYLNTHRDEIAVFEVAFRERRNPREVFAKVRDLAKKLAKPPFNWTPERLLDAYDKLGEAVRRNGDTPGAAEFIAILRHELGLDEQVRPYRSIVEERFAAWLARQEQQNVTFDDNQRWWLEQVAHSITKNVTFHVEDLGQIPFSEHGGSHGFVRAFGAERAKAILDDLNQELSA
ncbi:type I restriction enzyme R subunit [Saccharopolyspora phatthalungensis]|uniref:Type I restriction enzyme R subunit n=2 Tax=Saccharopolyspora phatthalungensis TaxID=664693 RepID=A0A840PZG7_9PSEU|nr:type I restriction enzyme R subunit [Saccharopolyspora phatthalungensis]